MGKIENTAKNMNSNDFAWPMQNRENILAQLKSGSTSGNPELNKNHEHVNDVNGVSTEQKEEKEINVTNKSKQIAKPTSSAERRPKIKNKKAANKKDTIKKSVNEKPLIDSESIFVSNFRKQTTVANPK